MLVGVDEVDCALTSLQVEGVNWLALNYHLGRGCLLADEMVCCLKGV